MKIGCPDSDRVRMTRLRDRWAVLAQASLTEVDADSPLRADEGEAEECSKAARLLSLASVQTGYTAVVEAIGHGLRVMWLVVVIGCLAAFLAGLGTGHGALGAQRDEPVNFYWALLTLLSVQTLALLLWMLVALVRPRATGVFSLAGVVASGVRRLIRLLHHDVVHVTVLGTGARAAGARAMFWGAGAVSHGLWLAFNIGAIAIVLLLLGARSYSFSWQTTILDEEAYTPLTRAIASIPELVGFDVPTTDEIAASQWREGQPAPDVATTTWSYLLIGCMVVYGIVPRVFFFFVCLMLGRRSLRETPLAVDGPPLDSWCKYLWPASQRLGVVEDGLCDEPSQSSEYMSNAGGNGPLMLIGLEYHSASVKWPPSFGMDVIDLGILDGRASRAHALEAVGEHQPRVLMCVVDVGSAPDRGMQAIVGALGKAGGGRLVLLLSGGQSHRDRAGGAGISQRVAQWRACADAIGIATDDVLEVDLDHLTATSKASVCARLGCDNGDRRDRVLAGHLDGAFAFVAEHAQRWDEHPSPELVGVLHTAIAGLYGNARVRWFEAFDLDAVKTGEVSSILKRGASSVTSLLPARLRSDARWLSAGALAGALGCVAAAFAAPVALTALPAWSLLGGAVAGVWRASRIGTSTEQSEKSASAEIDIDGAVRGAALYSVLLEVQAFDEREITELLDSVFAHDDGAGVLQQADVDAWLGECRHRFDVAMARSGGEV